MTPLEAVCRAMRDSEPGMEEKSWRYWLPSARAALLALAECDLPEGMLDYLPKFYSRQQAFSNVLRSIANEGKDNG